jgi:hypothetical protein
MCDADIVCERVYFGTRSYFTFFTFLESNYVPEIFRKLGKLQRNCGSLIIIRQ